ncbi:DUF7269 family protein [Halorubrum kocurii]|uniref:Uncharacterized protein n=1 Tax=Halorubrum kocurii JCM 14978 TaxID=1230456 RepID=M0NX86_9EURY|nr:hypothetical protein [Halorubrum kocurii]EMA61879.1 hypothetical protein C468_11785 [Halorubrum kocurii JCM 14978]
MRPLALVGVAAVAVGFVAVANRSIAAAIDPSTVVVTLIGALAVAQGARYANERRGRDRRTADPGEPERRAPATVPGAELDERIDRMTAASLGGYASRRELRERVRGVAVAAVARERNCSTGAADRAVELGTWTDDPTAAAFFAGDASYPVGVRVRAALRGRSRYGYGLRAAIDAVERLDPDGSDSPDGSAGAAR